MSNFDSSDSRSFASSSSSGIGCGGLLGVLLTVLFVGLKLGGVIAWSWLWVLSPLLIPIVLTLAVLIIAIAVIGVCVAGATVISIILAWINRLR